MRFFPPLHIVPALLLVLGVLAEADQKSITVYAYPTSASKPHPLAEISYNPQSLSATAKNYRSPALNSPEELVRVGLLDSKTSEWTGIVAAGSNFAEGHSRTLVLHLDVDGRPFHVSFSAAPSLEDQSKASAGGKAKKKTNKSEALNVVVKPMAQGPQPHLNRPVVLNAEGKVDEKEPEKTFLQKYWWVIALFIGLQVFSAAGGEK
ncbi:MAG: hypothetical protein M1820_008771 [Bogoriella megaspora]|nr:MAG: hypothetical protein M1820_008771 [Bogoriella megaspora]